MPPSPASGGTLHRKSLFAAPVVIALAVYGFDQLGPFLAKEDALQEADAILVLAGTPMRRPLEAADLYLAGYGPRIVLTRPTREGGELAHHLRRAGFAFRRELRGTNVQVVMRGTRYDGLEPHQWWRRRGDLREIIPEVPKLVAYVLGLGS